MRVKGQSNGSDLGIFSCCPPSKCKIFRWPDFSFLTAIRSFGFNKLGFRIEREWEILLDLSPKYAYSSAEVPTYLSEEQIHN